MSKINLWQNFLNYIRKIPLDQKIYRKDFKSMGNTKTLDQYKVTLKALGYLMESKGKICMVLKTIPGNLSLRDAVEQVKNKRRDKNEFE